jgi:hypothetical protein
LATARKTYRKNGQRRTAIFSFSLLLPFCMVFVVEMSCLIGKSTISKSDCLAANLCHNHSELLATTIENPVAQTAHVDDHACGSQHDHAAHEHNAQPHAHENEAISHEHEDAHSSQKQSLTFCEGHNDHDADKEGVKFIGQLDQAITVLENCCIDDSVRFFSTPTYFQSNYAIAPIQIPVLVFCELPKVIWHSLEEKAACFKPPENETFPSFSRFARFQVFLI